MRIMTTKFRFIMAGKTRHSQLCDGMAVVLTLISLVSLATCAEMKHVYTIPEEQHPDSFIGNVPQDTGVNSIVSGDDLSNLRYSFLTQDDPHIALFRLDELTGDLRTSKDHNKSLDRETICRFTSACVFVLEVGIKSILNQFFRTVELKIVLKDINDNRPIFPKNETTLDVSENVSLNTTILITGARDLDSVQFSIQTYRLESQDDSFGIVYSTKVDGTSEVNIFTRKELDFETQESYELKLIAVDGGEPPLVGVMLVKVQVTDVNDNKPKFSPPTYSTTVDENVKPNSSILTVTATDPDSGDNGDVIYGLSQHQSFKILKLFSVDSKSGNLLVTGDLQNEEEEKYEIIVEASDRGVKPYTTQTIVTVTVRDTVNDPPRIRVNLLSSRNFSLVSEKANIGTVVAHIAVHDSDRGRNGIAHCQLATHEYFELQGFDLNEYKVIVARPLDHELTEVHTVTVTCEDAGNPPFRSSASFDVRVRDENDNPPRFSQAVYYVSIHENNNIGDTITTINATDSDDGDNGRIEYSIITSNGSQFLVAPDTGEVKANAVFDYESQRSWKFTIKASDQGTPRLSATARVVVRVVDTNDERPKLTRSLYTFQIPENAKLGRHVGSVNAFDFEAGDNGKVVISLTEKDTDISPFYLFKNGSVVVQGSVDYEIKSSYRFGVVATDKGTPPMSSSALVEISILDENDNIPVIKFPNSTDYVVNVTISDKPDAVLTRVIAHDVDSGRNAKLKYIISSRNDSQRFTISRDSGEVRMARFFEERDLGTYKLMLTVQDHGLPPRAAHALLVVHVLPGNGTRGGLSSTNERNVLITVSLICLTAVVSAVIVLVIVVMRRNDRKRRGSRGSPVYVASSTTGYLEKSKLGGLVGDKDQKHSKSNDDGDFGFVLNGRNNNVEQSGHKDAPNQGDVKPLSSGQDQKSDQFSSLQTHQTLYQAYQNNTQTAQRSDRWPGYPDEVQSNGSAETATSDSGRGGSEDDSNEFHETSRESNQSSLKTGLKDPLAGTMSKRVTFKDSSKERQFQYGTNAPKTIASLPPLPHNREQAATVPGKQIPVSYLTSPPPRLAGRTNMSLTTSQQDTFSCPSLSSSSVRQCESPRPQFTPQFNDQYRLPRDRLGPARCSPYPSDRFVPARRSPYPRDYHNDSLDNDDDRSTTTSGSYTVDVEGQCVYLDDNVYRNVVV